MTVNDQKDKDKKQLLLRLSPPLWRELASWAEDDFRSINGQIEYLLTECVRQRRKLDLNSLTENLVKNESDSTAY